MCKMLSTLIKNLNILNIIYFRIVHIHIFDHNSFKIIIITFNSYKFNSILYYCFVHQFFLCQL